MKFQPDQRQTKTHRYSPLEPHKNFYWIVTLEQSALPPTYQRSHTIQVQQDHNLSLTLNLTLYLLIHVHATSSTQAETSQYLIKMHNMYNITTSSKLTLT